MDTQEAEDCLTEATSPTSFEPIGETQTITVELDESAPEEVSPSEEEVSHADGNIHPPEDIRPEEKVGPAEAELGSTGSKVERDSEKKVEPEGNSDSSNQSVDELLADWREDLEAFQQMEKDEL